MTYDLFKTYLPYEDGDVIVQETMVKRLIEIYGLSEKNANDLTKQLIKKFRDTSYKGRNSVEK